MHKYKNITVYYFCIIAILKNDLFTLILSSLVSVLSVWMPNVRFWFSCEDASVVTTMGKSALNVWFKKCVPQNCPRYNCNCKLSSDAKIIWLCWKSRRWWNHAFAIALQEYVPSFLPDIPLENYIAICRGLELIRFQPGEIVVSVGTYQTLGIL